MEEEEGVHELGEEAGEAASETHLTDQANCRHAGCISMNSDYEQPSEHDNKLIMITFILISCSLRDFFIRKMYATLFPNFNPLLGVLVE